METSTRRLLVASTAITDGIRRELSIDSRKAEPLAVLTAQAMAACGSRALAQLLVENGVIDEAEWAERYARFAELEVRRLEAELSEATGEPVSLLDPHCRRP